MLLHRQIQALLDTRASKGSLGALLLPIGRRALLDGIGAWKGHKTAALANDVALALAQWGEYPDLMPGLKPGDGLARIVSVLGSKPEGHIVAAVSPNTVKRATDLLSLPIVPDSVDDVVAFLNEGKTLSELVLIYRSRINDRYPEPINLAHHLADRGYEVKPLHKSKRIRSQQFVGGGLSYDVTMAPLPALGALLRIRDAKATLVYGVAGADARDLGSLHLDGTYEQGRILLGIEPDPKTLTSERTDVLARLRAPVPAKPSSVVVLRAGERNLIQSVTLRWPAELNVTAQTSLLVPLWASHGDARFEEVTDGTAVSLSWQDAQTRCTLVLPFNVAQLPEYVVLDRHGPESLVEREKAAHAFDQSQRRCDCTRSGVWSSCRARCASIRSARGRRKCVWDRRAERIKSLLPSRSQAIQVFDLPDGYSVMFTVAAPEKATFWPQQMFVRFNPEGVVTEVRLRYQETPRDGAASLYHVLRKASGFPEKSPAPWARLWSDLTPQGAPLCTIAGATIAA